MKVEIGRAKFKALLADAMEIIPELFADALREIPVLLNDEPFPEMLKELPPGADIFAAYKSRPFPIVIVFRGPVLRANRTIEDVAIQLRRIIEHELGHHLGLSEAQVAEAHRR